MNMCCVAWLCNESHSIKRQLTYVHINLYIESHLFLGITLNEQWRSHDRTGGAAAALLPSHGYATAKSTLLRGS